MIFTSSIKILRYFMFPRRKVSSEQIFQRTAVVDCSWNLSIGDFLSWQLMCNGQKFISNSSRSSHKTSYWERNRQKIDSSEERALPIFIIFFFLVHDFERTGIKISSHRCKVATHWHIRDSEEERDTPPPPFRLSPHSPLRLTVCRRVVT